MSWDSNPHPFELEPSSLPTRPDLFVTNKFSPQNYHWKWKKALDKSTNYTRKVALTKTLVPHNVYAWVYCSAVHCWGTYLGSVNQGKFFANTPQCGTHTHASLVCVNVPFGSCVSLCLLSNVSFSKVSCVTNVATFSLYSGRISQKQKTFLSIHICVVNDTNWPTELYLMTT